MDRPLTDREYLLERFPGKGGWTYVRIPEVSLRKDMPFGWAKVRGKIDSYELKAYKLMPMGDGGLFLPVKAEIRKQIKKEAGDTVHIVLFEDNTPLDVPQEIIDCLDAEPEAKAAFNALKEGEQKAYLDWIYDAKKESTKVERIVDMLRSLSAMG